MAMKDVKALQGFRGWVSGVLKALDSWEGRLRDVPGDLPDALDGDIAELALVLGRIQGALGKSRLESLAGSVGLIFPAYQRPVTEDDAPPVLAEEEEPEAAIPPESSGMLVRVALAHGGTAVDSLTPAEKRIAIALVRTKHLSNKDGTLSVTARGLKALRGTFATIRTLKVESQQVDDGEAIEKRRLYWKKVAERFETEYAKELKASKDRKDPIRVLNRLVARPAAWEDEDVQAQQRYLRRRALELGLPIEVYTTLQQIFKAFPAP